MYIPYETEGTEMFRAKVRDQLDLKEKEKYIEILELKWLLYLTTHRLTPAAVVSLFTKQQSRDLV